MGRNAHAAALHIRPCNAMHDMTAMKGACPFQSPPGGCGVEPFSCSRSCGSPVLEGQALRERGSCTGTLTTSTSTQRGSGRT